MAAATARMSKPSPRDPAEMEGQSRVVGATGRCAAARAGSAPRGRARAARTIAGSSLPQRLTASTQGGPSHSSWRRSSRSRRAEPKRAATRALRAAVRGVSQALEIGCGGELPVGDAGADLGELAFRQIAADHRAMLRRKAGSRSAELPHGSQKGVARGPDQIAENEVGPARLRSRRRADRPRSPRSAGSARPRSRRPPPSRSRARAGSSPSPRHSWRRRDRRVAPKRGSRCSKSGRRCWFGQAPV